MVRRAFASEKLRRHFDAVIRRQHGQQRQDYVTALAARISNDNPTLLDAEATVLVGRWTVGPVDVPGGDAKGLLLDSDLPDPGTQITARVGELCFPDCHAFGLEPHPLQGSNSDTAAAKALGLKAGAKAWLAYMDGRAAWLIVSTDNGPVIVTNACAADGEHCTSVLVRPQGLAAAQFRDIGSP